MRMGTDIMEAKSILSLLRKVMPENDLSNEPEKMFNVDERGIQLNDKGNEKFIAYKCSKTVLQITFGVKGKTVLACSSVEGSFIPQFHIFNGKIRNLSLKITCLQVTVTNHPEFSGLS